MTQHVTALSVHAFRRRFRESAVGPAEDEQHVALNMCGVAVQLNPGVRDEVRVRDPARLVQPTRTGDCPGLLRVNGKVFRNAEQEVHGPALSSQDFARPCNTAFASLAPRVPGPALPAAARELIGIQPSLGAPAFGGFVS
jgi:hypothetical protein